MRLSLLFFSVTAAAALGLLVRHAWRTMGRRDGLSFIGLLALFALSRETYAVWSLIRRGKQFVYLPDPSMASVAGVHFSVVGGWIFAAYLCFHLARLIRARSFPGTNVFFTLGLAGILVTTVSFAVETTGIAHKFWVWAGYHETITYFWLPFGYHNAALRGWMLTGFFILLAAGAFQYRLFSPRPAVRIMVLACLFLVTDIATVKPPWMGDAAFVWLTLLVPAFTLLGFAAPRWMVGDGERLHDPPVHVGSGKDR